MDLVIDIGNSFQKIAVFSDTGEILNFLQYDQLTIQHILPLFKHYKIKQSILSSVGEYDQELIAFLRSETNFIFFDHQTSIPLFICYEQAETLGSDRIAGAVAAHSFFPGEDILIVQAGSCLVYDFVDRKGRYLGGAISLGIEMRFKALHHFTAKLPLYTYREIDFLIGNTTQYSIESGVINGVAHEVNGFIHQYLREYPELKIILSGGDAARLQKSIKNTIFADQKFVLKGLHKILQFNVEKS